MDLLSNLDEKKWKNVEPSSVKGWVHYVVLRNKNLAPGKFEYALREDTEDGQVIMAVLQDGQGKTNPLMSARNAEMKVDKDKVVAINLDGDCVVRK